MNAQTEQAVDIIAQQAARIAELERQLADRGRAVNNYDELKKLAEAAYPIADGAHVTGMTLARMQREAFIKGADALRAAASAPKAELTDEHIRAAGGIVHKDGNIFFKNIDVLRAVLAQAAPVAVPEGWREFIENIATPYSEPLNSVSGYRDTASRKEMMGVLRAKAQELLAAAPAAPVAAAVPAGWQPIETAPKDGTNVLLSNGVAVAEGSYFHEEPSIKEVRDLDGRYIDQIENEGFDGWMDWGGGMLPEPTHWQPLPAAPAPGASK